MCIIALHFWECHNILKEHELHIVRVLKCDVFTHTNALKDFEKNPNSCAEFQHGRLSNMEKHSKWIFLRICIADKSNHFVPQNTAEPYLAQLFTVSVSETFVFILQNPHSLQIYSKVTQMIYHPPLSYYLMGEIKCQRCVMSHRIAITRGSRRRPERMTSRLWSR